jgi:FlaA1/EpsC-like NDP-sugar epimerase
VKRLVLISTDKASEPTSAMGASKMLAERLVLDLNLWSACHGNVVRFGNVFGSRGSVVPTLLRQLARENVATITDPECTRFTLPIDRAVQLVMRASEITRGSIAVLRMPAYRLDDLGYAIISVWNEGREAKATLKAVGLKPGERLHEALIGTAEIPHATAHGDWFIIDLRAKGSIAEKEKPHLASWSAERMERPKLIKAVREYMAEVQREMWE